ncbi:hypothetical protein AAZX31_12G206200 [Glycine max]
MRRSFHVIHRGSIAYLHLSQLSIEVQAGPGSTQLPSGGDSDIFMHKKKKTHPFLFCNECALSLKHILNSSLILQSLDGPGNTS